MSNIMLVTGDCFGSHMVGIQSLTQLCYIYGIMFIFYVGWMGVSRKSIEKSKEEDESIIKSSFNDISEEDELLLSNKKKLVQINYDNIQNNIQKEIEKE
jgi:hypothetical protein